MTSRARSKPANTCEATMSDHCVHCDPLCRGNDKNPHGCGTAMWDQGECVGCRERAAIVAWLRRVADHEVKDVNRYPEDAAYWCAAHIENGDHLGGDDE